MAQYGELRIDHLTFTTGTSGNTSTSVSGLVINPTFTGIVTCESGLNVSGNLNCSGSSNFDTLVVNNLTLSGSFGLSSAGTTKLDLIRDDTSIASGDILSSIVVSGNSTDGTYEDCAAINFVAEENHTLNNKRTSIVLSPTTSQFGPAQVLRVRGNGETLFNAFATALVPFPTGDGDGIPGQLGISLLDGDSASNPTGGGVIIKQNKTNSDRFFAKFYNEDGDFVGGIESSPNQTSFLNGLSDYRVKENDRPISNGVELVKQLNPIYYNLKKRPNHTKQGFFAHELQEVVPDAVTGTKDAVDENNKPIYQAIDLSYVIPCLTAAVKELIAKVEVLENELTALRTE
tara:strand:- start:2615 stop:3649 length:1035 start_codon:yes stop_codon:yes gene_type:complete